MDKYSRRIGKGNYSNQKGILQLKGSTIGKNELKYSDIIRQIERLKSETLPKFIS